MILLAQERDGLLRFLLRPSLEIGLTGGVELGPSYQKARHSLAPASIRAAIRPGIGKPLVRIQQSDEGGRFLRSRSEYAVLRIEDQPPLDGGDGLDCWVTLAELEALCRRPGQLTNEARSVVSPLLAFA